MKPKVIHLKAGCYDYSECRPDYYAACSHEHECGGDWKMTKYPHLVSCKRCQKILAKQQSQKEPSDE
jgi:hypothetical protein